MKTTKTSYVEETLETRINNQMKTVELLARQLSEQQERLQKLIQLQDELEVINRRLNRV